MSEAAQLLMKRANEIDTKAEAVYTATLKRAEEERVSDQKRVKIIKQSAREVCEHGTTEIRKRTSHHDHGRTEHTHHEVYCTICGMYLKDE